MSEEKKGMGAVVGSIFGVIVVGATCAAIGWFVRDMMPEKPKPPSPQMEAMKKLAMMPATVSTVKAEMRAYGDPRKYIAHAEPVQEVELLPQVDGYVKEILFKEGDLVKEGQVLYLLDDERYRAIVGQRKADLAAAEAECQRAERYHERMQKADSRGVTALERDNAEAGAANARAAVAQAQANLVVAEYDLKKAKVVAPISGQIGKTSAHVGDYVAPSKGALARIVQVDPIRVTYPMTDRDYVAWRTARQEGKGAARRSRLLLPGMEGDQFYTHGGKVVEGRWAFDDNTMSKETATIIMRLELDNADRLLVPNSFVSLVVDNAEAPQVPHVPQQALVDLGEGKFAIWVRTPAGTVTRREVTAGEPLAGWVAVLKGLSEGEEVVISGMPKLKEGAPVSVIAPTGNDDLDPTYKSPIEEQK